MDETRKRFVESLKTYQLRNLLLELLDTPVGLMSGFDHSAHNEAKTVIRAELAKRKETK